MITKMHVENMLQEYMDDTADSYHSVWIKWTRRFVLQKRGYGKKSTSGCAGCITS